MRASIQWAFVLWFVCPVTSDSDLITFIRGFALHLAQMLLYLFFFFLNVILQVRGVTENRSQIPCMCKRTWPVKADSGFYSLHEVLKYREVV